MQVCNVFNRGLLCAHFDAFEVFISMQNEKGSKNLRSSESTHFVSSIYCYATATRARMLNASRNENTRPSLFCRMSSRFVSRNCGTSACSLACDASSNDGISKSTAKVTEQIPAVAPVQRGLTGRIAWRAMSRRILTPCEPKRHLRGPREKSVRSHDQKHKSGGILRKLTVR